MERRLRLQLTMSVVAVLFVMLGFIVFATSAAREAQVVETADDVLEVVLDYRGQVPSGLKRMPDGSRATANDLFDAQFFTAEVDPDGQVTSLNLNSIEVVEEDEARSLAQRAAELAKSPGRDRTSGDVGSFRYRALVSDDGSVLVALVDLTSQWASVRSITLSMAQISVLVVVGVSVVFALVSKRIVEPIVRSQTAQRQFVVDAGHDLRTPISIISADADVLAMDLGQDNEWLHDIKRQVANMSELTESLIVLSRASMRIDRDDVVDLSAVARDEASSFRSRALTEGHELEVSCDADAVIRGNRLYLTRMVGALLDNAFKYASEGAPVRVGVERHARRVEVSVANAVDSVDPAEVDRWFDRFYQSEKSRSHRAGGFGIGLAMVRAVAEAHGGKARASATADGTGAGEVTITVVLPAPVRKSSVRDGRG
jgi:two-component system sensor histidine kinase CiaH